MAAIMRIVDGVGGATILDLNARAGGGIMNGPRGTTMGNDTASDQAISEVRSWWTPQANPIEVATRRMTRQLVVMGTSQDDVAARIQALTKAVAVPWILEVRRHGASTSGFLRCMPCIPQATSAINAVGSSFTADVTLAADTEPYALGAMVDTGDVTFTQDTSVAGSLYTDINGVQGDALAPTFLRWNLALLGVTHHGAFWSVRRASELRDTPSGVTGNVVQGRDFTASADSGANVTVDFVVADADFAGLDAARIVYAAGATTADYGTVTYTFPLAGFQAPGTYRLLARCRRFGGSAGIQHTVRVQLGAYIPQDYLYPAGGVDLRVLDLGLVQVPSGSAPVLAAPVAGPRSAAPPLVSLQVFKSGAAGAGLFNVDWVALVPADEDAGWWRRRRTRCGRRRSPRSRCRRQRSRR